jgi:hypothetical protein
MCLITAVSRIGGCRLEFGTHVSYETAPPGATAQIKISTASPQIVASGEISLNLDPNFFGSPTSIVPLSATSGGSGYASVSAGHVDIHFYNVGGIAQRPILAVTFRCHSM